MLSYVVKPALLDGKLHLRRYQIVGYLPGTYHGVVARPMCRSMIPPLWGFQRYYFTFDYQVVAGLAGNGTSTLIQYA